MKAQSMTSTSHIKNHDSLTHEKINRVMGIKEWGLIIVLSIIWGLIFLCGSDSKRGDTINHCIMPGDIKI